MSSAHIIWQNLDAVIHSNAKFDEDLTLCSSAFQSPETYIAQKGARAGNHLQPLITGYRFLSIVKSTPFFKKPPSTPFPAAIDSIDQNNNVHLAAVNLWMSNFEHENVTVLHSWAGLWTEMYILSLHLWFPAGEHLLPPKFTINLSIVNDTQPLTGRERRMLLSILIPRRSLNDCDKHQ